MSQVLMMGAKLKVRELREELEELEINQEMDSTLKKKKTEEIMKDIKKFNSKNFIDKNK